MEYKVIGIKQLHQQLKQVSEDALGGQSFMVMKNTKAVFKIEPIKHTSDKKYTLKDFAGLQFKCNDKNLSKNIDKIIYAI